MSITVVPGVFETLTLKNLGEFKEDETQRRRIRVKHQEAIRTMDRAGMALAQFRVDFVWAWTRQVATLRLGPLLCLGNRVAGRVLPLVSLADSHRQTVRRDVAASRRTVFVGYCVNTLLTRGRVGFGTLLDGRADGFGW